MLVKTVTVPSLEFPEVHLKRKLQRRRPRLRPRVGARPRKLGTVFCEEEHLRCVVCQWSRTGWGSADIRGQLTF